MDGLSVAASIMAVLDLTAKVIKYAKEAKMHRLSVVDF